MRDRFSEPQIFYTGVRWEPTDPKGTDQTAYFEYLDKNEEKTREMQKDFEGNDGRNQA